MALRGDGYVRRSEALCRILKTYRLEAGLTQQQLAERLGVLQTLVSKVESRERRLDVVELLEYLKPLGRTVGELLDEVERLAPAAADLDDSDGPAAQHLVVSGADLTLSRVLAVLDEALGAADGQQVRSAELVVALQRDDEGIDEVVVDLGRVGGSLRADLVAALRELGESR